MKILLVGILLSLSLAIYESYLLYGYYRKIHTPPLSEKIAAIETRLQHVRDIIDHGQATAATYDTANIFELVKGRVYEGKYSYTVNNKTYTVGTEMGARPFVLIFPVYYLPEDPAIQVQNPEAQLNYEKQSLYAERGTGALKWIIIVISLVAATLLLYQYVQLKKAAAIQQ